MYYCQEDVFPDITMIIYHVSLRIIRPLWLIYTAQDRDMYRELDQHNRKQWVLVPSLCQTSMNISVQFVRTH